MFGEIWKTVREVVYLKSQNNLGYVYYQHRYLNQCQEDKYENINLDKINEDNSKVIHLLAIFFIGLTLISLPSITWFGIETYFNINYVGHNSPDGSPIILSNNLSAVDPTYEELIIFLKSNQVNQSEHNLHPFLSAQKLQDKAEKAGYKCSWVLVTLEGGKEQVCNAFNTTDRGLIFVDHTINKIEGSFYLVDVNIGGQYIPKNMFNENEMYDFLGTIEDYKIYW